MNYYISVLVPLASGRWRALFPDLPDCNVEAADPDLATMHAANALYHYAETLHSEIRVAPPPRDLADIRSDKIWSGANAIDWHSSVITMIPLRG
jgi:hypothetical protein